MLYTKKAQPISGQLVSHRMLAEACGLNGRWESVFWGQLFCQMVTESRSSGRAPSGRKCREDYKVQLIDSRCCLTRRMSLRRRTGLGRMMDHSGGLMTALTHTRTSHSEGVVSQEFSDAKTASFPRPKVSPLFLLFCPTAVCSYSVTPIKRPPLYLLP